MACGSRVVERRERKMEGRKEEMIPVANYTVQKFGAVKQ